MDFFNSLTLDLKLLVVAIAGATLLAFFSGNRKSEKRYMLVLAVLVAAAVYRFNHLPVADDQTQARAAARAVPATPAAPTPARKPLESTFAK